MPEVPAQIVVRLSEPQRAALGTVLQSLATPHRIPPSVSEAVRASIVSAAQQLATIGTLSGALPL